MSNTVSIGQYTEFEDAPVIFNGKLIMFDSSSLDELKIEAYGRGCPVEQLVGEILTEMALEDAREAISVALSKISALIH